MICVSPTSCERNSKPSNQAMKTPRPTAGRQARMMPGNHRLLSADQSSAARSERNSVHDKPMPAVRPSVLRTSGLSSLAAPRTLSKRR